jgi:hypothetical protein
MVLEEVHPRCNHTGHGAQCNHSSPKKSAAGVQTVCDIKNIVGCCTAGQKYQNDNNQNCQSDQHILHFSIFQVCGYGLFINTA